MLLDTPLTEQAVLGLPRYTNVQYWSGLAVVARHVIDKHFILKPCFVSGLASRVVASNTRHALARHVMQHNLNPRFLS